MVVLLLVSMALGLSYAAVRSQYTGLQIQRNSNRRVSARQAAVTGLTMAIKKMHTDDWAGVGTALSGSLGSYEHFQVTYTTGDPSLHGGHPQYEDFPYRVTLLSTGHAAAPDNPTCFATHRIRAVVRLLPRQLADEPTDWATMQQYTVYQSNNDFFELDVPCRLEGPIRVQGTLKIAMNYPTDSSAWSRYLSDLDAMRLTRMLDYRPLSGPVDLPFTWQDERDLAALSDDLSVTARDTPVNQAASDWTNPVSPVSYQIYGGGPVYTISIVNETLENVSLEPDPLTNPLGICRGSGSTLIRDNVTIRGSLFCKNDLKIEGINVRFQPLELPALHGSAAPVRLPAASCQNFTIRPTAEGSLAGLVAVFDTFQIDKSPDSVKFDITGRLITRQLFIKEREPWETMNWPDLYTSFQQQLQQTSVPVEPYFPVWLGKVHGLDPKPLLTVKPDSSAVTYHWNNWYNPVYVPHPDDDGLRWDLLEWTENP